MRPNRIREIWSKGDAVINGWLTIPSAYSAEHMANQGWDSCTVDMQHGAVGYQTAVDMLTAISTTEATPLCRVPWLDPGIIGKMLDAGAYGVICPMVNTRADAEALVTACRYPPRGTRSFGPNRAILYGGKDYAAGADDVILAFAMIETATAIENLDEILSVDGLDALYIGPADLSLSLGRKPGLAPDDPTVVEAIETILAGARRHGVHPGIHTGNPEFARKMIEIGFEFVSVSSDARYLAGAAGAAVAATRGAIGKSAAARGDEVY